MVDTLSTKAPSEESELQGCDQITVGEPLSTAQPQHFRSNSSGVVGVLRPSRIDLTLKKGMSARKRSSENLSSSLPNAAAAAITTDPELPTGAVPLLNTLPSNKKLRVSFCQTTKQPSDTKTQCPPISKNHPLVMKHSVSCTSLPSLTPSSDLLISEASTTDELDLSVSPANFVQTIVLQSKSITGSIRGEDIISDASQRVKHESYFLAYTDQHLHAYTSDVVNAVQGNDAKTLRALFESGHLMQASNRFGESMLHTSCRRGYPDVVEFFINEAKVSPRVRDDMGRTPMHDACWSSASPNHHIMKMLICTAPELLLSKDKRGHSPFDYARREYWPNWVTFLNENRQFIVNSLVSSYLESSEHLKDDGTHSGVGCVADQ